MKYSGYLGKDCFDFTFSINNLKVNNIKKVQIIISLAAAFFSLPASAQLRVFTNGNVGVKTSASTSNTFLSVGNKSYGSDYRVYVSSNNPATGNYNIGMEGWAYSATARNNGRAIGIRGVAGNCTTGFNYGVVGALQGSNNGAGVYGTVGNTLGTFVNGKYAGYFEGDVMASGTAKSSWDGSRFRFYDTGTDHPMDSLYDVTCEHFCDELAQGYAFANINTHGSEHTFALEGNDTFLYNNANTFTNVGNTIVVTESCKTNDFSDSYCLGSHFINNPNGVIMAYYGCSDDAIGNVGGILGSIDHFCGNFYNKLFSQAKNLGEAMRQSRISFIGDCSSYNPNRWNYFVLNMLGDPEMPVYTSVPLFRTDALIYHSSNNFIIQHNSHNGYHCIMSRLDGGNSFYDVGIDYGSIEYNNLQGEYLVTLSDSNNNSNYVPYCTIMGSTVNLQNEVLRDNLNVVADFTYIGSDIANDRPTGGVVVENGHSVIDSRYGVTIKNNFEVLPGASLEIRTNHPQ